METSEHKLKMGTIKSIDGDVVVTDVGNVLVIKQEHAGVENDEHRKWRGDHWQFLQLRFANMLRDTFEDPNGLLDKWVASLGK